MCTLCFLLDKCEQENVISSVRKELEILHLQAEQLSKKTLLREKQLDDTKKQNVQEEQGYALTIIYLIL